MATISRLLPYQLWEIDAIEGWLDDMATRGFLLQKSKGRRFVFLKTQPQAVRHRIDVLEDEYANTKVRREEYRDFGWEHVTDFSEYFDIYRAMRDDAVELNTDEEHLRMALEKAQRRNWALYLFIYLLCTVVLVWVVVMYIQHGIYYPLLTQPLIQLFSMPVLFAYVSVVMLLEFRSYRRLKHRTLLERTYHTRKREKEGLRGKRWVIVLHLLFYLTVYLAPFTSSFGIGEVADVPDSAYQVYSAPEFLPAEGSDDVLDSVYHYHHGLSEEYTWSQRGGTRYVHDYQVTVYEARWDWLARRYAEEQARLAGAEALNVAGHESAWFYIGVPPMFLYQNYRPAEKQNVVLLDGSRVVEIRYDGDADLRAAALALN